MGFSDRKLISLIETLNLKPVFVDKFQLDQLANENHQGIIIDVGDFKYCDLDDIICDDGLIVILDHLEDTHNFGAIIRTCEYRLISIDWLTWNRATAKFCNELICNCSVISS